MNCDNPDVIEEAFSVTDPGVPSLDARIGDAVTEAIARTLPEQSGADPLVRRSDHADLQSNAALALARSARRRPADIAAALVRALRDGPAAPLLETASVSGPGFVNITVTDAAIWRQVGARLGAARLGAGAPYRAQRTVIDYSAPNIAKQMHVGHLRTTIIGDSLARVLDYLGAEVIRQNHLGDWGTQFGMLIQYLDEHPDAAWHHQQLSSGVSTVSALDGLYRAARARFDTDAGFADRARARVVALQAGERATTAAWREIVAESQLAFRDIYRRLGVLLTDEDAAPESFYNPMLPGVVAELAGAGIAVDSDGALCVFSADITGPDGTPVPLMVRKSDGGFGYDATDLATIRYRTQELKADRILYVVDARQALHFRMVFDAARRAGWLTARTRVDHVAFGTVLGADGTPIKTRSGETAKLTDLLDAAVDRARTVIAAKSPDLSGAQLDTIAEQAGVGAVKYADLATSRGRDYLFDIDRMVSFTGNTGMYLQYAHTRIASILRRAGRFTVTVDAAVPPHPSERALALALDAFGDTVAEVGETLEPHRLCGYLYGLARSFTDFYENCRVLDAADTAVRTNRLALCRLTAQTLRQGLDLLGIPAPQRL